MRGWRYFDGDDRTDIVRSTLGLKSISLWPLAKMDPDTNAMDVESSSSEAEEVTTSTTQLGDVTVVQEERILDRTGQDVGDPQTELEDLAADLLEVDYTNTRLRSLPPLAHLFQVEVRPNDFAPFSIAFSGLTLSSVGSQLPPKPHHRFMLARFAAFDHTQVP